MGALATGLLSPSRARFGGRGIILAASRGILAVTEEIIARGKGPGRHGTPGATLRHAAAAPVGLKASKEPAVGRPSRSWCRLAPLGTTVFSGAVAPLPSPGSVAGARSA